ncbi:hypothetical protein [Ruegeria halocynthiae]|nr:hypothetical protein [Ruegeria halocynthiae]
MNTRPTNSQSKAEKALELLDQAWAYYTPESAQSEMQREPELFEYANAA